MRNPAKPSVSILALKVKMALKRRTLSELPPS